MSKILTNLFPGKNRALSDGDRRYADLKAIHSKMWSKNGLKGKDKFDERQLWAYGCHCHLLGDRPLSEMGRGAPKVRFSSLIFVRTD